MEQIEWKKWLAPSIAIIELIAILFLLPKNISQSPAPIVTPTLAPRVQPTAALSLFNQGIQCTRPDDTTGDCVQIFNGGNLSMYSNNGSALKFQVNGGNGNATSSGTVTGATIAGTTITGTNFTATALTATNLTGTTITGTTLIGTIITGTTITGTTVTGTTVNGTNLQMGGIGFTGAIKYGTVTSYTQGASITHGFATTPTVCIINPVQNITATYTITTTGFSSNMDTTANPIYWFCGK